MPRSVISYYDTSAYSSISSQTCENIPSPPSLPWYYKENWVDAIHTQRGAKYVGKVISNNAIVLHLRKYNELPSQIVTSSYLLSDNTQMR